MSENRVLILNGSGPGNLSEYELSVQQLESQCAELCQQLNMDVRFYTVENDQMVSKLIFDESDQYDALIVNPAWDRGNGSTQSDAIRGAINEIANLNKIVVEVHLDNIFLADGEPVEALRGPEGQTGLISGLGPSAYFLALKIIHQKLNPAVAA